MKLSDFIVRDALVPTLEATERDDAIAELIDALVAAGAAPKSIRDELFAEIIRREKTGSTGFGKGVAVPHVKHKKIKKMAAAIGVSQSGVDFNALDKQPVFSIVLLLSPLDQAELHLQAMENIFSNLQNETFRRFLRQSSTRQDIEELVQEADAQQLSS
jgi:mannitol/fructose-specific phosphotransferase system IIA component (Ntr-type)